MSNKGNALLVSFISNCEVCLTRNHLFDLYKVRASLFDEINRLPGFRFIRYRQNAFWSLYRTG